MQAAIPEEFWLNRSVMVTGGTGLLGCWLVPALESRGARVVELVRGAALSDQIDGPVHRVHGALTDGEFLRGVIEEHAVSTIFHLAAQTVVAAAAQDPAATLDTNVRGTWTVLEASRTTRQCQVLVASSAHVYGDSRNLPYSEDHPVRSTQPYSVSKCCADLICEMYATAYGQPTGIARFANLFGGRDRHTSRGIPGVIQATLRNEPFRLRGDGQSVRDYLYVEDAAEACIRLAECLAGDSSLKGQAFNFSLEQKLTIAEVVDAVLKIMGRSDLRPIVQGIDTGEIQEVWLSSAKARRLLNWAPRWEMHEGLRRTIHWYRGQQVCPAPEELAADAAFHH